MTFVVTWTFFLNPIVLSSEVANKPYWIYFSYKVKVPLLCTAPIPPLSWIQMWKTGSSSVLMLWPLCPMPNHATESNAQPYHWTVLYFILSHYTVWTKRIWHVSKRVNGHSGLRGVGRRLTFILFVLKILCFGWLIPSFRTLDTRLGH